MFYIVQLLLVDSAASLTLVLPWFYHLLVMYNIEAVLSSSIVSILSVAAKIIRLCKDKVIHRLFW